MKNFLLITLALCSLAISGSCKKDDPKPAELPKFILEDLEFDEGAASQTIEITVKLERPVGETVTVDYRTADGSAVKVEDYLAATGTVTFAPNDTEETVTLNLVADDIREADEVFYVIFENPQNATLASFSSDIVVVNDDKWLPIDTAGYTSPTSYMGYNLLWADEFDGTAINTANWVYDLGDGCPDVCGWGNNELEYYTDTDKNSLLIDGHLVIEAHLENKGGRNYTSARMKSQGKKTFTYGRIDIRAKLPKGQGIWPALWMLGEDIPTVGWPACGEIDIMEHLGHESSKVYGTGHWKDGTAGHKYKGGSTLATGADFNSEFHVFSVDWQESFVTWLVDGVPFFTLTPFETGPDNWPYDHPFFFIFNIAVGGNWPGNPDNSTTFPQRMFVDYVRVFEKA